jgi:hypothetical protein
MDEFRVDRMARHLAQGPLSRRAALRAGGLGVMTALRQRVGLAAPGAGPATPTSEVEVGMRRQRDNLRCSARSSPRAATGVAVSLLIYRGGIGITAMSGHIRWPSGTSGIHASGGDGQGNATGESDVERDGASDPAARVPL